MTSTRVTIITIRRGDDFQVTWLTNSGLRLHFTGVVNKRGGANEVTTGQL